MVSPQVYCDIEEVLMWFGSKEYSSSMPKVYRFTIYPLLLDYIMNMLSAAADAYELKEGRVENINKILSNLAKVRTVSRLLRKHEILSLRQHDYLDRVYVKIETGAKKWRSASKKDIPE